MSIIQAITGVFTEMGTWISSAVTNLLPMFYATEGGLTFLGVLAVASLGISITFLLINVISNFLHFRG